MLQINNLSVQYQTDVAVIKAVDGIDLSIAEGEIAGLVGESGCGKSTVALSILRLINSPGKITGGEILWQGKDVLKMNENELLNLRGKEISMIFQDPFSSLNPVFTVGEQIAEVLRFHAGKKASAAREKAVQLLAEVKISDPERCAASYPHVLSGGMRQRSMIAMALACQARLLIADEPTTALDVTIQAEILELLSNLRDKFGLSLLLITHNLAIVSSICDRVCVLEAGKIVEEGKVGEILKFPRHSYTQKLLKAVPRINYA